MNLVLMILEYLLIMEGKMVKASAVGVTRNSG